MSLINDMITKFFIIDKQGNYINKIDTKIEWNKQCPKWCIDFDSLILSKRPAKFKRLISSYKSYAWYVLE